MPQASRLYNLEKLHEIDGTNDDFIGEIITAFLNTIPAHAKEMLSAANEQQWDKVYFLAHKMKANIDLLNIASIKEEIRIVEKSAKTKTSLEQIPRKAKFINTTIQRCAEALREDFNK